MAKVVPQWAEDLQEECAAYRSGSGMSHSSRSSTTATGRGQDRGGLTGSASSRSFDAWLVLVALRGGAKSSGYRYGGQDKQLDGLDRLAYRYVLLVLDMAVVV